MDYHVCAFIAGFAGVEFQRRVREANSRAELAEAEAERRQVRDACRRGVAGKLRGGTGGRCRDLEFGRF